MIAAILLLPQAGRAACQRLHELVAAFQKAQRPFRHFDGNGCNGSFVQSHERMFSRAFTHRALGALPRLSLPGGCSFDLTFEEARTLSRALSAVAEGKSSVDEIYLSPIASDRAFSGKVTTEGLWFEAVSPPFRLAWPEVAALAAQAGK